MPNNLIGAPNLQSITIRDFTPGIFNGNQGNIQFSTQAPLGSASSAYRCYATPGFGLCPFPTYSSYTSRLYSTGGQPGAITIAAIKVFPNGASTPPADSVYVAYNAWTFGTSNSFFVDNQIGSPPGGLFTNVYTNIVSGGFTGFASPLWPNYSKAFWVAAGPQYVTGLFGQEPTLTAPVSILCMPDPQALVPNFRLIGILAQNVFKTAFVTERMALIGPLSTGFAGAGTLDLIYTTDIQATSNLTGPEFFNPEQSGFIGTWGTVSTGEFIIIYQGGGGTIVYGDIQFPSSAVFMPAITGTGSGIGPGIPTPIGLVYCTDYDGVWVWNGGNTSQKISNQLVDNNFIRPIPPNVSVIGCSTHNDVWDNWVFFANNWVFDCLTNSWWQCENPATALFDCHAGGALLTQNFYSGSTTAIGPGITSCSVVQWNKAQPANSYRWVSNPISQPGALVSMQAVEIVASNPASTPAEVIITPTAPPGTPPYPNQNTNQALTFTLPPNVASYRAMQTCGFSNYNICLQIDASNPNTTNSAPIIHEITVGFNPTTSATP